MWRSRSLGACRRLRRGASYSTTEVTRPELIFRLPCLNQGELQYIWSQLNFLDQLPSEAAQLQGFSGVVNAIRKTYYPDYLKTPGVPKSQRRHLDKDFRRPIVAYRNCEAFQAFQVPQDEVCAFPALLNYDLKDVVGDLLLAPILDVPLHSVRRTKALKVLRGHMAVHRVDQVQDILEAHEFTTQSHKYPLKEKVAAYMERKRHTHHNNKRFELTFNKLNDRLLQIFLKNTFSPDVVEIFLSRAKSGRSLDVVQVIRMLHLYLNVFNLPPENPLVISAIYKCPIQFIINVNNLYRALAFESENQPTAEQFLNWLIPNIGRVNTALDTVFLPPTLRKQMLLDIGFDVEEANSTILRSKVKFTANNCNETSKRYTMYYSHPKYVSEMKRRLSIIRSNADKLGILKQDYIMLMTDWERFLKTVRVVIENGGSAHSFRHNQLKFTALPCTVDTGHPIVAYLKEYYPDESKSALSNDLFRKSEWLRIGLNIFRATFHFLYDEKQFSKEDIRAALPVLASPKEEVARILDEMELNKEAVDYQQLKDSRRILLACNYFLEFGRSVTGENNSDVPSLETDFSQSLYEELETQLGFKRENNERKAC